MNKQELRTLLSQAEEDNNTEPIILNDNEEEIKKPYDEWYGSKLAEVYLEHAKLYYEAGLYKDAEHYYWEAFKAYDSIYDDDLDESDNSIAVLVMLARFYLSTGRPWKALTICRKVSKALNHLEYLADEFPYWGWGLDIIIIQGQIYAQSGYEETALYYYEEACNYLHKDEAA